MKVLKQLFVGLASIAMLSGCAHRVPNELAQISNLRASANKTHMDDMRATAIKETAATLGAQSGLAWRAQRILPDDGRSDARV